MLQGQEIIYTARSAQDAHLLRNLLADERISAVVLNEGLANGVGVDVLGWATAARVAVADSDARRARQIAVKFDRKRASQPGRVEGIRLPQESPEVPDHWPRCPECDAPRTTRCPICGTSGSSFAAADHDFAALLERDEAIEPEDADAGAACSCGHGTCGAVATPEHRADADEAREADDLARAAEDGEAESPAEMVLCPTCDEPFRPEYPRRCEWCGYTFDDGTDLELPGDEPEDLNIRAVAIIVGLAALLLGGAAYFLFVGGRY